MTWQTWLEFVGWSVALAFTPGPDILSVLTRSVAQGTRAGIIASLGFASGLTVHTTLAVLGVAAFLKAWPAGMWTIRCVGAAYLLYLAIRVMFSHEALNLAAVPQNNRRELRAIYSQSILMNVLNPKVTLFLLLFLPKSVDPHAAMPVWLQLVLLGATFAGCTIVCFGACAIFAGSISGWLRRQPGAGKWLRWGTAVVFVGIAAWILVG